MIVSSGREFVDIFHASSEIEPPSPLPIQRKKCKKCCSSRGPFSVLETFNFAFVTEKALEGDPAYSNSVHASWPRHSKPFLSFPTVSRSLSALPIFKGCVAIKRTPLVSLEAPSLSFLLSLFLTLEPRDFCGHCCQ